jgi:hypothetical protein
MLTFNTQLENGIETRLGLHVNGLLSLSDLNQKWNMSPNFSKTPGIQLLEKSVRRFSNFYLRVMRQTDIPKLVGAFLEIYITTQNCNTLQ